MLKIFALILAWIALTSCKPESEQTCGYLMHRDKEFGYFTAQKCLTEPAKRPDGLFMCISHQSKIVALANVVKIEEWCW